MSTFSRPFFTVRCDWPGCTEVDDMGEFSAWADQNSAYESAYEGYWAVEAEPKWRRWSEPGAIPAILGEEPITICPDHRAEHGYWLSDGPGDGYPGGSDPSPLAEDAFVVVMPDGELVVMR